VAHVAFQVSAGAPAWSSGAPKHSKFSSDVPACVLGGKVLEIFISPRQSFHKFQTNFVQASPNNFALSI